MSQSPRKALEALQRYESLYGKRTIKIIGAANHERMPILQLSFALSPIVFRLHHDKISSTLERKHDTRRIDS